MSRWRLIVDGACHGAWNMGVDEALLMSVVRGERPALRLYRWSGPWLSLGYRQRLGPRRRAACTRAGVGLVRRVSGGGAVLHGGDLTYALAARETDLPSSLAASYALVAGALVEALRALGIAAAALAPGRSPRPERAPLTAPGGRSTSAFACFASAADHEICVAGRKLAGSAQRRVGGGVLQHGSIRLRPADDRSREVCGGDAAAVSLAELGFELAVPALPNACARAFARALGARFEPGGLSAREREWAERRVQNHPLQMDFAPRVISEGTSREPIAGR